MMMKIASRSQLWNACLGNLFEHYDTALFGYLSAFLAPLIFPKQEPITALILTYAMIP
jgi:MHS family proline/betaine transporter-like MFS transporter